MPKATKSAHHEQHNIENNPTQEESNIDESSSEQEIDQEVTFNPTSSSSKYGYVIYSGSQDGLDCK